MRFINRFPQGLVAIALVAVGAACAGEAPAPRRVDASPNDDVYQFRAATRDGIGKYYMGREIAHVMGHLGAGWLERPTREREERTDLLLENLPLEPGSVAADIGAGTGYFSLPMARLVGPQGRVLAVDIQPEMLRLLQARAAEENIKNIEPILGNLIDPKLPHGKVDLILCADVYHEFTHPEHMLRRMRAALSPNGTVVLAEFREEDPNVPILPLHKMSKKQILRELPPNGYRLARQFDGLPWQHLMFFRRDTDKEHSSQ